MNSENGSPSYSIAPSAKFTRAVKVLQKSYKSKREAKAFLGCIGDMVDAEFFKQKRTEAQAS